MSLKLLSDFAIGDTNFDNIMTTLQKTYQQGFSLSNFDNISAPVLEKGSVIDVGGALYIANADEAISTTDPYTSATVADGAVYIVCQASGSPSTVSLAWTATAPVWRADYQGYYKTATVDRYIGGCNLSGTTTVFNSKFLYDGLSKEYYQETTFLDLEGISGLPATVNPAIFTTTNYDTKGLFNSSTGYITIKENGYYTMSAWCDWGDWGGSYYGTIAIKKGTSASNVILTTNQFYINSGGYSITPSTTISKYLVRGDSIFIYATQTSGISSAYFTLIKH